MIEQISIVTFIWYIIRYFGYNLAIKKIQEDYNCTNFSVSLFCKKIWVLDNKKLIEVAFSRNSDAKLTYMNDTFFASHPHNLGIGNVDFENGHCLWEGLHDSLSYALQLSLHDNRLEKIMEKHKTILIKNNKNVYNLPKALENFTTAVWAEFCFGDKNLNIVKRYTKLRKFYLDVISDSFYNHSISMLPIIGWIFCKTKCFINKNKYKMIDEEISDYITNADESSFFLEFELQFRDYNTKHNIISDDLIDKVVLDNAFLSILVVDFIDIVCKNAILELTNKNIITSDDKNEVKQTSLYNGFLFPWRARKINQNNDIFKVGDYVLGNIKDTRLFFSCGPRSCIGPRLFNKFYGHLLEILKPFELSLVNPENKIVRCSDENRPFIISKHKVRLNMSKYYLETNLKSSYHNGIEFYHIHEISQDPILFNWIINEFISLIKQHNNNLQIDGIVSAEARGWIFAAPVAQRLGLPLITVRKKGKLPGDVIGINYKKDGYGDEETIEIQSDIGNKNLVIIDDGIASGVTTDAIYKLVSMGNNVVPLICTVIKYSYVECKFNPNGIKIVSLFNL